MLKVYFKLLKTCDVYTLIRLVVLQSLSSLTDCYKDATSTGVEPEELQILFINRRVEDYFHLLLCSDALSLPNLQQHHCPLISKSLSTGARYG